MNRKYNNVLLKKGISAITMTAMLTLCAGQMAISNVSAHNQPDIAIEGDSPNLYANYDEDSTLCKKLEYDSERNRTDLNSSIEKKIK